MTATINQETLRVFRAERAALRAAGRWNEQTNAELRKRIFGEREPLPLARIVGRER